MTVEIKNKTIAFRMTPSQRKLVNACAAKENVRPSDWVRAVVLAALAKGKRKS